MQQKIKICIMQCGKVGVDPAVPVRDISANPLAYTGLFRRKECRIWLPVFTYLIVHPKGNILVDTAWSKAVRTHPQKAEGRVLAWVSRARLPVGMAVDEQLQRQGIKIDHLHMVILTHMDVDHVNGISLVGHARCIMAAASEIQQANRRCSIRYHRNQWKGIPIEAISFQSSSEGVVGKEFDVFGDGTIRVFLTPGHSAGSVTILVANHGKRVLLAGDTGYARTSWRDGRLPGPVYSKEKMLSALDWVKKLEQTGCLVFASHDPNVQSKEIEL